MENIALANNCIKLTKLICKSSKGFKISIRFDDFHFLSTSFPEWSMISSVQTKGNLAKKRKSPLAIKRSISRKNAFLLLKKKISPTTDDLTNEVLENDVNSASFHDFPIGDIIQLDGAENFIEYNIPITENFYQCLQENITGNAIQGSIGPLQTGLDTSRIPTDEDLRETLLNPWSIMESHKGKTKRGHSPVNGKSAVKGKGMSSRSSSSSSKVLTQPPQSSILSPDRTSSEAVKEQMGAVKSGNEE